MLVSEFAEQPSELMTGFVCLIFLIVVRLICGHLTSYEQQLQEVVFVYFVLQLNKSIVHCARTHEPLSEKIIVFQ